MDSKNLNRLSMLRRVEQLLESHQQVFVGETRFPTYLGKLKSDLSKIDLMQSELQQKGVSMSPTKNLLEALFHDQIRTLAEILMVILNENGDLDSLNHLQGFKTRITKGTEVERLNYAELILYSGEIHRADLEVFSNGKFILDSATQAHAELSKMVGKPRNMMTENAILRAYLYADIRALADFVKGPVKAMVMTYKNIYPELWDQFISFSKVNGASFNEDGSALDQQELLNQSHLINQGDSPEMESQSENPAIQKLPSKSNEADSSNKKAPKRKNNSA